MLKNTEKNSKIIKHKSSKRYILTTGVIASSLFMIFCQYHQQEKSSKNIESTQDDNHNRFSNIYQKIYETLELNQFDQQFLNIYQNGQITIKDEQYTLNQIYLKKCEDETVHFIVAGKNKIDLLTKEVINSPFTLTCSFKNTDIFYQMYLDGIIKNEQIEVNPQIYQLYANTWNGERHEQTPELKSEIETNKIYQGR